MKCCSWGPFARCSRASPFSIADLRVILENLTCPQFGSHPHVFPRWFVSKLQPNGTSRMKYHGIWTSPDFAYFNLSSTLVFMLPFGKLRITMQHFPTFNRLHTTCNRWIFQPVQPPSVVSHVDMWLRCCQASDASLGSGFDRDCTLVFLCVDYERFPSFSWDPNSFWISFILVCSIDIRAHSFRDRLINIMFFVGSMIRMAFNKINNNLSCCADVFLLLWKLWKLSVVLIQAVQLLSAHLEGKMQRLEV